MGRLDLIVITPETPRSDEPELIREMFRLGVSRIHLRHPGLSADGLRNIIGQIPLEYRGRLSIHDHFHLAEEFPELGINLNGRNPLPPSCKFGALSRSCHSIDETRQSADYCLLSPIFPSLSKPGYSAEFSAEELLSLPPGKVFALGGINGERIAAIKRYPFRGVAVLGAVWNNLTAPADVINNVAKILEQL